MLSRNWIIAFAAGAVVIGCTGGTIGGGTTGTTTGTIGGGTTGTPPGRSVPTVNLETTFSDARVVLLSGIGRTGQTRAPGSEYAKLNNFRLINSGTDIFPPDLTGSLDGVNMRLDGYTVNKATMIGELGTEFKVYNSLGFFLDEMREEDIFGNLDLVFAGPPIELPRQTVYVPMAPGRQTTVQMFLSNATLFFDNGTGQPVWDQAAFDIENEIATTGLLRGFFSDHVAFDLSGMAAADRPQMQSGAAADKVLFSGDAIGAAAGVQTDGSFDLYSVAGFVESGVLTNPVNVGGDITPGSYTVLEPDPQSITPPITKISALQGAWRNYTDAFGNLGDQSVFVFPTTRPSEEHQIVMINRSGGVITALWYGTITFSGTTGTFEVWSVDQLDNGTKTNSATGTIQIVSQTNGVFKDGDYTVTATPTGFPFTPTGTFAIYQ